VPTARHVKHVLRHCLLKPSFVIIKSVSAQPSSHLIVATVRHARVLITSWPELRSHARNETTHWMCRQHARTQQLSLQMLWTCSVSSTSSPVQSWQTLPPRRRFSPRSALHNLLTGQGSALCTNTRHRGLGTLRVLGSETCWTRPGWHVVGRNSVMHYVHRLYWCHGPCCCFLGCSSLYQA